MLIEVPFPYSVEIRRKGFRKHEHVPLLGKTFVDLMERPASDAPIAFAIGEKTTEPKAAIDLDDRKTLKIRAFGGKCYWPRIREEDPENRWRLAKGADQTGVPYRTDEWLAAIAENKGRLSGLAFPNFLKIFRKWPDGTDVPDDTKQVYSSKFDQAEAGVKRRISQMFICDGQVYQAGSEPRYVLASFLRGETGLLVGGDDATALSAYYRETALKAGNLFRADRLDDALRAFEGFKEDGECFYRHIGIYAPAMVKFDPNLASMKLVLKNMRGELGIIPNLPSSPWWGHHQFTEAEDVVDRVKRTYVGLIAEAESACSLGLEAGLEAAQKVLQETTPTALRGHAYWAFRLHEIVLRGSDELARYGSQKSLTADDETALEELTAA